VDLEQEEDVPAPLTGEAMLAATGVRRLLQARPKRITMADQDRAEMMPREIRRSCRRFVDATQGLGKLGKQDVFDYETILDEVQRSLEPEHLQAIADTFKPEDHDLAADYLVQVQRVVPYLQSIMPVNTEETLYKTFTLDPSDSEIARFRRAFDIAEDPMTALRDMERGILVPDQIKHLEACYPQTYALMKETMANEMASALARKKSWRLSYWRDRETQILFNAVTWNEQLASDCQSNFKLAANQPKQNPPSVATSSSKAASNLQTKTQQVADGSAT
jgi:hypothetical protein